MLFAIHQPLIASLVAAGFFALTFDVVVGHFADRTIEHSAQVPGALAPFVCGLIVLLAVFVAKKSSAWFRRLTLGSGVVSLVTGGAGAWFHVAGFADDLAGEVSWESLLDALSVAPPLLAPLAFVALGAVLIAMNADRWQIDAAVSGSKRSVVDEAA